MNVFFTKDFKKAYAKRIAPNKNLDKRFEERYDLFVEDPTYEILKDYALSGRLKGHRAFSITEKSELFITFTKILLIL